MKGKVYFLLHSDFGVGRTIGARAYPIAKELKSNGRDLEIFCRDYNRDYKNQFNFVKVPFLLSFLTKILTYINIHIDKKFINNIKQSIISNYFKFKLSSRKINDDDIFYSVEFFPSLFSYIKKKNPNTRIIQDVPIALNSMIALIPDHEKLWNKNNVYVSNYIKNSFEYIDEFTVPSNFVKKSLTNEKIKKSKITVILFGVDISKFKPKKKSKDKLKICIVGNVNKRKGANFLINAIKELNLKDIELHLYGLVYPEIKPYLHESSKFNIYAHGFKNSFEVMPDKHLYILPSFLEGSSKSIYEAMACQMPVITTENAGSVIKDGEDGFIIEPGNVDQIKQKILFFYNDREKLE